MQTVSGHSHRKMYTWTLLFHDAFKYATEIIQPLILENLFIEQCFNPEYLDTFLYLKNHWNSSIYPVYIYDYLMLQSDLNDPQLCLTTSILRGDLNFFLSWKFMLTSNQDVLLN